MIIVWALFYSRHVYAFYNLCVLIKLSAIEINIFLMYFQFNSILLNSSVHMNVNSSQKTWLHVVGAYNLMCILNVYFIYLIVGVASLLLFAVISMLIHLKSVQGNLLIYLYISLKLFSYQMQAILDTLTW